MDGVTHMIDGRGFANKEPWESVEAAWYFYDVFGKVNSAPVYFAIFDRRMATWPNPLSEISSLANA